MSDWQEHYLGGSAQAERAMIEQFARDMRKVQARMARKTGRHGNRTLHAKIIAGFHNARLAVDASLPHDLAAGYFQPGEQFPVSLRFSNASPIHARDGLKDMRGAALRIHLGENRYHDLLSTSFPVSHARDAWQFVEIAKIATGPKPLVLPRLLLKLGLSETLRVIRNVNAGNRPVESLVSLPFWSRAPLLWGEAGPVRYMLRPSERARGTKPDQRDFDYLERNLAAHLALHDVTYRLALQRYVDATKTPIEDGAAEWREADTPFIEVATLVIPRQNQLDAEGLAMKEAVNALAFNPWNCPPPFRPLGSLNRARGPVYASSAEGWLGTPPPRPSYC